MKCSAPPKAKVELTKFRVGQKVYFEFGYGWFKGRVVSVDPLLVKGRPGSRIGIVSPYSGHVTPR